MNPSDPLTLFLPPVQQWFRTAFGEPTAAQRQGWPAIRAGQHTLILAPTGSGKTLAAFLACLDSLWRTQPLPRGLRVLYISPLKALNNDIYRNLQLPLAGIATTAQQLGQPLAALEVAVRTGDTPTAERQRLLRRPPHLLITTPESLHLLLTSRARETLRGITHCIIDEIHALCANKRGVFLALLLERLAALNPGGFLRIGLSATQRPLEEVARYLGGQEFTPEAGLRPRPVTIVDAGLRKDLDLQVVNPVEQFGPLAEKSIWPAIYRFLSDAIHSHRSTIIFANNRRAVERITANLNAEEEVARAHHGSVALEVRQATEQALKEGRLPAVVATASLELGIDMGAVDLVCQVESPGSVARGLQRVGRAGHLVGQKSKGRLIPKTPADLLEQAVLAHEMAAGRVEAICVPSNCLDVLAQQVVALVAMEPWEVPALYALVRQAYPYRDLTPHALETVLEMVTGRFRFEGEKPGLSLAALQPRISWDRVHNRLLPLPGSRSLALVNGGTIPNTGQYPAYTSSGVRIGELDEEFIYERRVGDTFLLGTNTWRLERIEADRVVVAAAEGAPALVPFWRGEQTGRSYDLSMAQGRFLRTLTERLEAPDCLSWLEREFFLDAAAARNLRSYVRRQLAVSANLPTDDTVVLEAFRDPLGDWQIILLSTYGSQVHLALRLVLEARLRQRLSYTPRCLHHAEGLLIHLTESAEPPLDLFEGLTPENVEGLLLGELADSALFALRFRQNAARALLLPQARPGQRAPLWLQRLRGRDLLQVARRHPDFPIVAETFRECLHEHLDLPHLRQLLTDLRDGRVRVATRRAETPSPFAAGLLFAFTAANMYQYDGVAPEPNRSAALDPQLLQELLTPGQNGHLLDPRAVQQVEHRLRGVGQPPRTATEMAEWLRRLGDVAADELDGSMVDLLRELEADGRARQIILPAGPQPQRWILTEEAALYEQAFAAAEPSQAQAAAETILSRFLQTHALVGLSDLLARYPFDTGWAQRKLEEWAASGRLVTIAATPDAESVQWSAPVNLEQVQRGSLALLRREVVTCSAAQFVEFLLRWQGVFPLTGPGEGGDLATVLDRLEGISLPAMLWEQTVLPARVPGYQPRWLDEAIATGEWTWVCQNTGDEGPGQLAFWRREHIAQLPPPPESAPGTVDATVASLLERLRGRGASFVTDLAVESGLAPSALRAALWTLLRQGLVTNDRLDVVRRGEDSTGARRAAEVADRGAPLPLRSALLQPRSSLRRRAGQQPEGRWSLLAWGRPDAEEHAVFLAGVLLQRYGIVARELALLDPSMPPWRVLYEVLSRMEWAGTVRRGYFVEGLSGAQFALPEAHRLLQECTLPSSATAPVVLLNSSDPANLYGSGAPFEPAPAAGEARPLSRRPGNWLVLRAGRPVLLFERPGKRVTTFGGISKDELTAAVACLPSIQERDRGLTSRPTLTVELWNEQPVTQTEGRELLEPVGFVRDYRGLTRYAAWQ